MSSPSPSLRRQPLLLGDRYVVQRKLGDGSLGTVYLVEDTGQTGRQTENLVALKVLRTERFVAGAGDRLREEFRALASLRHPQIAAALDFGHLRGAVPFYTREYVEGTPLPPGPAPRGTAPGRFLRPIVDLLDALEHLHGHSVLHLDIHPGNLILAREPSRGAVLIDFGLVLPLGRAGPLIVTTDWPLPPEVVERGELTAQSDIYMAGRLLLHRLTGRAAGEVRLPREIPGWGTRTTLHLERIAAKALDPEPERRFRSAAELREALCEVGGDTTGRRPRAVEPHEPVAGRKEELAAIEQAIGEAALGKTALVWFTGTEGSGRTRLLAEARLRAQLAGGLEVAHLAFFPDPGPGPALARALGAGRRDPPRWLQPLAVERGGTPEERAARAAVAFFRRSDLERQAPLVLFLDDIDHARGDSRHLAWSLIGECIRARKEAAEPGRRGLAIVATSAAPPPSSVPDDLIRSLGPLSAADARRLLEGFLRPLRAPERVLRRAVARAGRLPLALRHMAIALGEEWGRARSIPGDAVVPELRSTPSDAWRETLRKIDPADRRVLEALAVIDRPATSDEVRRTLGEDVENPSRALRRLERLELIRSKGRGATRRYYLSSPEASEAVRSTVGAGRARDMHRRLAEHMEASPCTPGDVERIARHWLGAGRARKALDATREALAYLRRSGDFDRAVGLLESIASVLDDRRTRVEVAEEISELLAESGDHRRGTEVLEPFHTSGWLEGREAVRVGRRLGIHYHRAGRIGDALAVFNDLERRADPERDIEDLVFIDSELAEIHVFHGAYVEADAACRRGLRRLQQPAFPEAFRRRMEVTLRASLGHLELRRLELERARRELRIAARLARRHGTRSEELAVLVNLAIALNQLGNLDGARRAFERARKLLSEAPDAVKVATNLAVVYAKLGERENAYLSLERAARQLRQYADERLEFFTAYSRGIVAHHFGEAEEAREALDGALERGRRLGDRHLVGYGEVYLAEAHLACGRYEKALEILRASARTAEKEGATLLLRMCHARLLLVEVLLGRPRTAEGSAGILETVERSPIDLLEAWNDLYSGFAGVLASSPDGAARGAPGRLRSARRTFRRLRIPLAERLAGLALVVGALERLGGEDDRRGRRDLRALLASLEGPVPEEHAFLAALEPLVHAEARFALGEIEAAEDRLREASGAIVGRPFLELDLRIEILRTRLALARGETAEARRHRHRSAHTRDLLEQLVPAAARRRFVAQPRFRRLEELGTRLDALSRARPGEIARKSPVYHGMVGRSRSLLRVFRTIEGLHEREVSVLIRGETGTGKELVARAIHATSSRRTARFLAVHCASLPPELFESELFGHEKGAYTGAGEARTGILEEVDGGTLLLDEVGELQLECQAKLLRFLDTRVVRRLGGESDRTVDVRILASTSGDIEQSIRAGRFRADLYYRIRVVDIDVPPLRERAADIGPLARHLIERHAKRANRATPSLRSDALRVLEGHAWPGNVRELETVVLRLLIERDVGEEIGAADVRRFLRPPRRRRFDPKLFEELELDDLRRELEREYLTDLFLRTGGDSRRMMEKLGVKRTQLYARFRSLGIDVRELRRRLRPGEP